VCYELVNMMFKEEPLGNADPNIVGRDGSSPLMVCLVPLINKDPLHSFTHTMKVFYLNCIRLLLQHGANPNCSYRSNLTPLHILIFTVSENFTVSVNCDIQKRANFDFIKNILILLLQHGLDCKKAVHPQHILQSIVEMVQNVRRCTDVLCIYELLLLILQYGGDANVVLHNSKTPGSIINEALSFESSSSGAGSSQMRHLQVSTSSASSHSENGNGDGSKNSFRNNGRNFILFYFIMLIMRKEFILTDSEKNYLKIINLFYATMRHDVLYSCLKSLHNLFIVQVPTKSTEYLINYIESLYRKPRNLKELCRVTIYESLDHKLAQNINRFNMPGPIKDYVLNFE
jgi:ankyrin repeat protein